MWGTAFADIAKKAREQAEGLSQLQAPVSGLFNLDSMMKEGGSFDEGEGDKANHKMSADAAVAADAMVRSSTPPALPTESPPLPAEIAEKKDAELSKDDLVFVPEKFDYIYDTDEEKEEIVKATEGWDDEEEIMTEEIDLNHEESPRPLESTKEKQLDEELPSSPDTDTKESYVDVASPMESRNLIEEVPEKEYVGDVDESPDNTNLPLEGIEPQPFPYSPPEKWTQEEEVTETGIINESALPSATASPLPEKSSHEPVPKSVAVIAETSPPHVLSSSPEQSSQKEPVLQSVTITSETNSSPEQMEPPPAVEHDPIIAPTSPSVQTVPTDPLPSQPPPNKDLPTESSTSLNSPQEIPQPASSPPPTYNTPPEIIPPATTEKKTTPPVPPQVIERFMQQIQKITENHQEEIKVMQEQLAEKERLLQERSLMMRDDSTVSMDTKFKELEKQEEYYQSLLQEQKIKLDEERAKVQKLKFDCESSLQKEKELHTDADLKIGKMKEIIVRLQQELESQHTDNNELKTKLTTLQEDQQISQINIEQQNQKIIKNLNTQLEEERTKVQMLKMDLVQSLEKEKEKETNDKQKLLEMQEEMSKVNNELNIKDDLCNELKDQLETSKKETITVHENYESLKSRVKIVATELRDRRQECRDLHTTVGSLTENCTELRKENEKLKSDIGSMKSSSSTQENELQEYKETIEKLQSRLQSVEKKFKEVEQVGNTALQQYKKKAQAALANANGRAAAANQAREEMELEIRALKAASDQAESRAITAEQGRKETTTKLTAEKKTLEGQYLSCRKELDELTKKWEDTLTEKEGLEQEVQESVNEQHRLYDEIQKSEGELEKQKEAYNTAKSELQQERQIVKDLTQQLRMLKEYQERTATAAFLAKQNEGSGAASSSNHNEEATGAGSGSNASERVPEDEGTIAMLYEELEGANEAIKDLKKELRNALLRETAGKNDTENDTDEYPAISPALSLTEGSTTLGSSMAAPPMSSNSQNSATPLFYAIEKQAELNIARDEINRLANMIGEVESDKMKALEEVEEMRKRMEEAETRLRRHEKLGRSAAATARPDNTAAVPIMNTLERSEPSASSTNDDSVDNMNLEYLKNITLRYINAKTLTERKALIPVIAAVLCLTEDEKNDAERAVEEGAALQNVGTALIESTRFSIANIF